MFWKLNRCPEVFNRPRIITLIKSLDQEQFICTRDDLSHAFSSGNFQLLERLHTLFDDVPAFVLSKVKTDLGAVVHPTTSNSFEEVEEVEEVVVHPTPENSVVHPTPANSLEEAEEVVVHPTQKNSFEEVEEVVVHSTPENSVVHPTPENSLEETVEVVMHPTPENSVVHPISANSFEEAEQVNLNLESQLGVTTIFCPLCPRPLSHQDKTALSVLAFFFPPRGLTKKICGEHVQALLEESATLEPSREKNKASETKSSKKQPKSAENKVQKIEVTAQLVDYISSLPYVKMLELADQHDAGILAHWYTTNQTYVLAMTKMLDQQPDCKQLEAKLKKIKKLQKSASEAHKLETQLQKELTGRKNKDNIENLVQQIAKSKKSLATHAAGTKYDVESADLSEKLEAEIKQLDSKLDVLNEDYAAAQFEVTQLSEDLEELDSSVRNVVKRGYHKASLKHHPDKLGEDITEEQQGYWNSVTLALQLLTLASSRIDYFNMRDHNKFVAQRAAEAQVGAKGGVDTKDGSEWKLRLTSSLPPKCAMPMLCEEEYGSNGKCVIQVMWSCANAVTLEVTRYDLEVRLTPITLVGSPAQLYSCPTPELKVPLVQGITHYLRVRAVNIAGMGEWSQPMELCLEESSSVNDAEIKKKVLEQAIQRKRVYQQNGARDKIQLNLSTLACRHSLAYENLSAALDDARKLSLPANPQDTQLFERAKGKLLVLQEQNQNRQNQKDWKKKILPFPNAQLLSSVESSEISSNVSNMMKQHLNKKATEMLKVKLVPDLQMSGFNGVLDSLLQAQCRTDIFRNEWCMEFQELKHRIYKRLEPERKRRAAEEEKFAKKLVQERAVLEEEQQKMRKYNELLQAQQNLEEERTRLYRQQQREQQEQAQQQKKKEKEKEKEAKKRADDQQRYVQQLQQQQQQQLQEEASAENEDDLDMLTDLLIHGTHAAPPPVARSGVQTQMLAPVLTMQEEEELRVYQANIAMNFTRIDLGAPP